jgi:hypothetical protein
MKPHEDGLPPRKSPARAGKHPRGGLTSDERHRLISEAIYERADGRGGLMGADPSNDRLEPEPETQTEERRPQAR